VRSIGECIVIGVLGSVFPYYLHNSPQLSAQLWSNPVDVRQLRAPSLRAPIRGLSLQHSHLVDSNIENKETDTLRDTFII